MNNTKQLRSFPSPLQARIYDEATSERTKQMRPVLSSKLISLNIQPSANKHNEYTVVPLVVTKSGWVYRFLIHTILKASLNKSFCRYWSRKTVSTQPGQRQSYKSVKTDLLFYLEGTGGDKLKKSMARLTKSFPNVNDRSSRINKWESVNNDIIQMSLQGRSVTLTLTKAYWRYCMALWILRLKKCGKL